MWWGYHAFCPFAGFFFVLFVVFVLFAVSRIFGFRRHGGWHPRQGGFVDAEAILKRRLANGEITDEDYLRLKELLTK